MWHDKPKIAIVGSYNPNYVPGEGEQSGNQLEGLPELQTESSKERFHTTCKALGEALAKNNNTIMLFLNAWESKLFDCEPEAGQRDGFIQELNTGTIPPVLKTAFTEKEVCLKAATVEVEQENVRWIVACDDDQTTGKKLYVIQMEGQSFAAYEPQESICDSVVAGAEEVGKNRPVWRPRITLSTPNEKIGEIAQIHPLNNRKRKVDITSNLRPVKRGYYPESFPSVQADAIILISGGQLTEMVACVGHYVKSIPVVPIASFGGAAKALYSDIFRMEYEQLQADSKIGTDIEVLDDWWQSNEPKENEKRAEKIVALTEELILQSRRKSKEEEERRVRLLRDTTTKIAWWLLIFCLLVAFSSMVAPSDYLDVLRTSWENGNYVEIGITTMSSLPVRVFGLWTLLFLSASLGINLRIAVSYDAGEIPNLDSQYNRVSKVQALVLALGLGLIYLVGGWSFSGAAAFPDTMETIASSAVVMSIMGLAGGFLLPVEELRGRLQGFLTPDPGETTPSVGGGSGVVTG